MRQLYDNLEEKQLDNNQSLNDLGFRKEEASSTQTTIVGV
jgi:hypothetical protein